MSADKVTSSCIIQIKEETDDEVAACSYSPSDNVVKVKQENNMRVKTEEETTDDEDNMKKMPSPVKSDAPSPVASAKLKEECYDAPTPPLKTAEGDNSNICLESMDDDILLKILQYVPNDSTKLGLLSNKWRRQKNPLWKILAVNRWGNGVVDNNTSNINWYQYYYQRCSTSGAVIPNEISHLDLIQEQYTHDPYHMLTACILSSRTSGGTNVRLIVSDFMTKYPTPTSVINSDASTMEAELYKLGLNREKTMKQFADGFLKPWVNITELRGCAASLAGPSLTVFCHGDYKSVLKDKKAHPNVKAYATYLKKRLHKPSKEEGGREAMQSKKRKRVKTSNKTTAPTRRMTRNR